MTLPLTKNLIDINETNVVCTKFVEDEQIRMGFKKSGIKVQKVHQHFFYRIVSCLLNDLLGIKGFKDFGAYLVEVKKIKTEEFKSISNEKLVKSELISQVKSALKILDPSKRLEDLANQIKEAVLESKIFEVDSSPKEATPAARQPPQEAQPPSLVEIAAPTPVSIKQSPVKTPSSVSVQPSPRLSSTPKSLSPVSAKDPSPVIILPATSPKSAILLQQEPVVETTSPVKTLASVEPLSEQSPVLDHLKDGQEEIALSSSNSKEGEEIELEEAPGATEETVEGEFSQPLASRQIIVISSPIKQEGVNSIDLAVNAVNEELTQTQEAIPSPISSPKPQTSPKPSQSKWAGFRKYGLFAIAGVVGVAAFAVLGAMRGAKGSNMLTPLTSPNYNPFEKPMTDLQGYSTCGRRSYTAERSSGNNGICPEPEKSYTPHWNFNLNTEDIVENVLKQKDAAEFPESSKLDLRGIKIQDQERLSPHSITKRNIYLLSSSYRNLSKLDDPGTSDKYNAFNGNGSDINQDLENLDPSNNQAGQFDESERDDPTSPVKQEVVGSCYEWNIEIAKIEERNKGICSQELIPKENNGHPKSEPKLTQTNEPPKTNISLNDKITEHSNGYSEPEFQLPQTDKPPQTNQSSNNEIVEQPIVNEEDGYLKIAGIVTVALGSFLTFLRCVKREKSIKENEASKQTPGEDSGSVGSDDPFKVKKKLSRLDRKHPGDPAPCEQKGDKKMTQEENEGTLSDIEDEENRSNTGLGGAGDKSKIQPESPKSPQQPLWEKARILWKQKKKRDDLKAKLKKDQEEQALEIARLEKELQEGKASEDQGESAAENTTRFWKEYVKRVAPISSKDSKKTLLIEVKRLYGEIRKYTTEEPLISFRKLNKLSVEKIIQYKSELEKQLQLLKQQPLETVTEYSLEENDGYNRGRVLMPGKVTPAQDKRIRPSIL